jgi:hypothetical protein
VAGADMLEVGNGEFTGGNVLAVGHFTMWCMMKVRGHVGVRAVGGGRLEMARHVLRVRRRPSCWATT